MMQIHSETVQANLVAPSFEDYLAEVKKAPGRDYVISFSVDDSVSVFY